MKKKIDPRSILVKGQRYETDGLDAAFVGWTGTGTEGYNIHDYFGPRGEYRGPDQHGIEPMFETNAIMKGIV